MSLKRVIVGVETVCDIVEAGAMRIAALPSHAGGVATVFTTFGRRIAYDR